MTEGLLWFDDTANRSLADKVTRAAAQHFKKYQRKPTLCYVNPAAIGEQNLTVNGVQVLPALRVLPDHFWIGRQDTAPTKQGLEAVQDGN